MASARQHRPPTGRGDLSALLSDPDLGSPTPDPSSVALAVNLQKFRSSISEPYFKSKHARVARPAESAELQQLRKESTNLGKDFQALLSAHERQEAAGQDLRGKLRTLRSELEARDKALELARRTVERLSAEKGQLEAGVAGTQTYVRKLESRLLSARHGVELQQRCMQQKAQLDALAHALAEAEACGAEAQAAAQAAQLDVACLKRGLELAAEQLTKSAGAEVPGTLLRAVARGQEEALGLSVQLSDAKQQVAQLTAALEQARAHLQAQQDALGSQQEERQELRQRLEASDAALEKQRAATSELRRVVDALRPKAGALAEERDSLRQQLELERTAAAEAHKEVKQLRAALRQKASTEAALRDELRRALAGQGFTPSPLAKQAQQASVAAAPLRSGSRADSGGRRPAAAKRAPSGVGSPAGARLTGKAALRRGSSWLDGECDGGGSGDRIPAEHSPTRALLRLQEQQRTQQGSRLGARPESADGALAAQQDRQAALGWEASVAGWQAEGNFHAQLPQGDKQQQQQQQGRRAKPPLLQLAAAAQQQAGAAAALPLQDGRLMQVYAAALDEQIALLEGDLAQLSEEPSPIAKLQAAAKAGAIRDPQVQQQQAQQQRQAQQGGGRDRIAAWRPNGAFQRASDKGQGAGGLRELVSPGADTPAAEKLQPSPQQQRWQQQQQEQEADNEPAPHCHVWHSNPLAASPPPKQPLQQAAPEAAARQVAPAAGALTVRAMPSAQQQQQEQAQHQQLQPEGSAAVAGPALPAAVPGAATVPCILWAPASTGPTPSVRLAPLSVSIPDSSPAEKEEWLWGQLQQALSPAGSQPKAAPLLLEGPGSVAASSPSLRLPATRQQQHEEREVTSAGLAAELQAAVSEGSCGGVESLSRRWDLPSPGPGTSDWLSNEFEADIEQLEVNSHTPRKQPAPEPAPAAHGGDKRPASVGSAGDWAGDWQAAEPAAVAPQAQRAPPMLPGLPLVADSPAAPLLDPALAQQQHYVQHMQQQQQQHVQQTQQQQQQQQQYQPRTFFDLAADDIDLSELLS